MEVELTIDPRLRTIDQAIEVGAVPASEVMGGHSIELEETNGVWHKPDDVGNGWNNTSNIDPWNI